MLCAYVLCVLFFSVSLFSFIGWILTHLSNLTLIRALSTFHSDDDKRLNSVRAHILLIFKGRRYIFHCLGFDSHSSACEKQ